MCFGSLSYAIPNQPTNCLGTVWETKSPENVLTFGYFAPIKRGSSTLAIPHSRALLPSLANGVSIQENRNKAGKRTETSPPLSDI